MKKILILMVLVLLTSGCVFNLKKEIQEEINEGKEEISEIITISEYREEELEEEIEKNKIVDDVDVKIAGKIVYLEIEYEANVKEDEAKNDSAKCMSYFTKEELSYYDINIVINGKDFVLMGVKNYKADTIIWSK